MYLWYWEYTEYSSTILILLTQLCFYCCSQTKWRSGGRLFNLLSLHHILISDFDTLCSALLCVSRGIIIFLVKVYKEATSRGLLSMVFPLRYAIAIAEKVFWDALGHFNFCGAPSLITCYCMYCAGGKKNKKFLWH